MTAPLTGYCDGPKLPASYALYKLHRSVETLFVLEPKLFGTHFRVLFFVDCFRLLGSQIGTCGIHQFQLETSIGYPKGFCQQMAAIIHRPTGIHDRATVRYQRLIHHQSLPLGLAGLSTKHPWCNGAASAWGQQKAP